MRVAAVALVLAAVVAGCGGGSNKASPPAKPLTLGQRLLTSGEMKGYFGTDKRQYTNADAAAKSIKDVLFHPKQTAAHLRSAGFSAVRGEAYHSAIRVRPGTRPKRPPPNAGAEIDSIVFRLESPSAATSLLHWMWLQAEQPCPGVCDVRIEPFDAQIPNSEAVERSRPKKTPVGQPFDEVVVGFADGPFIYAAVGHGAPNSSLRNKVVSKEQSLYDRVHGAPAA